MLGNIPCFLYTSVIKIEERECTLPDKMAILLEAKSCGRWYTEDATYKEEDLLGLWPPSSNTEHHPKSHLLDHCFANMNSISLVESSVLKLESQVSSGSTTLQRLEHVGFQFSVIQINSMNTLYFHIYCLKYLYGKNQLTLSRMFLPPHHLLLP